jgi:hypothetical protein
VHAHRRKQIGVALGQANDGGQGLKFHADAKGVGHAILGHALENIRFVFDQVRKIQMAVGINKH